MCAWDLVTINIYMLSLLRARLSRGASSKLTFVIFVISNGGVAVFRSSRCRWRCQLFDDCPVRLTEIRRAMAELQIAPCNCNTSKLKMRLRVSYISVDLLHGVPQPFGRLTGRSVWRRKKLSVVRCFFFFTTNKRDNFTTSKSHKYDFLWALLKNVSVRKSEDDHWALSLIKASHA